MKILLAIPAYRCPKQIRRVVKQLCQDTRLQKKISHVMIFDNQSPDETAISAHKEIQENKAHEWIQVVRNKKNYGLGGTHKVIFAKAFADQFDYAIVMHGDDQALPDDIHQFFPLMEKNYDAILGARFHRASERFNYSRLRTMGNMGLNKVYSTLTGKQILDLGSGLNAFRINSLNFENLKYCANDLTFNFDLLLDLVQRRKNIIYVPISWREVDQVSNAKSIKIGLTALKTLAQWRLGQKKKPEPFFDFGFDNFPNQ